MAGKTIRTFISKHRHHWRECLPAVELAFNSATNTDTGLSPSEIVFGRRIRPPNDKLDRVPRALETTAKYHDLEVQLLQSFKTASGLRTSLQEAQNSIQSLISRITSLESEASQRKITCADAQQEVRCLTNSKNASTLANQGLINLSAGLITEATQSTSTTSRTFPVTETVIPSTTNQDSSPQIDKRIDRLLDAIRLLLAEMTVSPQPFEANLATSLDTTRSSIGGLTQLSCTPAHRSDRNTFKLTSPPPSHSSSSSSSSPSPSSLNSSHPSSTLGSDLSLIPIVLEIARAIRSSSPIRTYVQ
ncbi:hypothetical protein Pst134EA_032041 [Puccinia striiformis f. sp. tritici]|uniref:uncharacterized protein n=1 Tax=Puccinia striiformis f. sp. tritici TaxID=168172 RepID=UPI002007DE86|nr:uncharacterized protein Pst134EA_032041 [Puccinia striiformis f. sp. tritici]KAH9440680.1 hypothetical protein Pst134EA_032041 [Puccinia striiformis f. sp. tritici]